MLRPDAVRLRIYLAALPLMAACAAGRAAPEESGHPWDVLGDSGISDARFSELRGTDTLFEMTAFGSLGEWEAYAEGLRRRILVSCGLWPMPDRPPLNARVFNTIHRGD